MTEEELEELQKAFHRGKMTDWPKWERMELDKWMALFDEAGLMDIMTMTIEGVTQRYMDKNEDVTPHSINYYKNPLKEAFEGEMEEL